MFTEVDAVQEEWRNNFTNVEFLNMLSSLPLPDKTCLIIDCLSIHHDKSAAREWCKRAQTSDSILFIAQKLP